MIDWAGIAAAIGRARGQVFCIEACTAIAGGSINDVFLLEGGGARYFVKVGEGADGDVFAAEAAGLAELAAAVGLRVPAPVTSGMAGRAFLVLEYIELQPLSGGAATRLGEALADMHGIVRSRYGWHRDNTIGDTPQHNAWHPQWQEFWRENRLAALLDRLAPSEPSLARLGEALLGALPDLLAGHRPEASLVHGDLWRGNVAMDGHGVPVLFDPAVYYGDRETDLAMAELFGGFSPLFFEAYWGAWPMAAGYRTIRRPLYQLYHLLNHALLFGAHYGRESERVMRELLARL